MADFLHTIVLVEGIPEHDLVLNHVKEMSDDEVTELLISTFIKELNSKKRCSRVSGASGLIHQTSSTTGPASDENIDPTAKPDDLGS